MIQDAQVYLDYPGHTLSKFHTECRRGMQGIKWLVVIRGIAVKPTVVKGLAYYWIMSDFIFTLMFFFKFNFSNANSQKCSLFLPFVEKPADNLSQ